MHQHLSELIACINLKNLIMEIMNMDMKNI